MSEIESNASNWRVSPPSEQGSLGDIEAQKNLSEEYCTRP